MFFKRRSKTQERVVSLMDGSPKLHQIPFQGASMDPSFQNANSVWIDFSNKKNLKVGDVVVYQTEGKEFVCHRLIGIKNNFMYVKGDNSLWVERVVIQKEWGRAVAIEKNGSRHELNNQIFLRLYCWFQMRFHNVSSVLGRRLARKMGQIYLRLIV